MAIVIITLLNLAWIIYSITEGVREGFYWNYESKSRVICDVNVNRLFNIQRIIFSVIIGGVFYYTLGLIAIPMIIGMFMMFPFFHNGTYYLTRNKFNNRLFKLKWRDDSNTYPKKTFIRSYKLRLVFLYVGIMLQLFTFLIFL